MIRAQDEGKRSNILALGVDVGAVIKKGFHHTGVAFDCSGVQRHAVVPA